MRVRSIGAACALLALAGTHARADAKQPAVADAMTTVSGTLRTKVVFGPPGFGETPKTDSTARIYFIELPAALTAAQLHLPAGGADLRDTYAQVQLWCGPEPESCERFLRRHVSRRIVARGTTAFAVAPMEVLPVNMTVRDLRPE